MGVGPGEDGFAGTTEAGEERQFGAIEGALAVRDPDLMPDGTRTWASHLTSLNLSIFINKGGEIISLPHGVLVENHVGIYGRAH